MNVALFGYGKMGRLIEQVAIRRNHNIAAIKDVDTPEIDLSNIDVGIDFSTPEAAFENITTCLENGIPVVSGTTGWLDRFDDIKALCDEHQGAFLYASNFSLGVNLFFALNSYLAELMSSFDEYKGTIEEIHHVHKLDAPSGTAISLAEGIIDKTSYVDWELNSKTEDKIPITSKREGEIPGTHAVQYHSDIDDIEIKHTAHSREGFALGAVIAAEWLQGKSGVFGMKDVLNIG